jgi:hypothetical protein
MRPNKLEHENEMEEPMPWEPHVKTQTFFRELPK